MLRLKRLTLNAEGLLILGIIFTMMVFAQAAAFRVDVATEYFEVYYQFADPRLEALPSSQKLLVRMGPVNRQRIKDWLTVFKQAFASAN